MKRNVYVCNVSPDSGPTNNDSHDEDTLDMPSIDWNYRNPKKGKDNVTGNDRAAIDPLDDSLPLDSHFHFWGED